MDTKDIIASIDTSGAVMDAQIRKLAQMAPRAPATPRASSIREGANELLGQTVLASFTAAAESLQALADAETEARQAFAKPKPNESNIIDGTATEVAAKEES